MQEDKPKILCILTVLICISSPLFQFSVSCCYNLGGLYGRCLFPINAVCNVQQCWRHWEGCSLGASPSLPQPKWESQGKGAGIELIKCLLLWDCLFLGKNISILPAGSLVTLRRFKTDLNVKYSNFTIINHT